MSAKILTFIKKSLSSLASILFSNWVFFLLLGTLNRILGAPIKSVFLVYPANKEYAAVYLFPIFLEISRKKPVTMGFFKTSDGIGLVISSLLEGEDFTNKDRLEALYKKCNKIKKLIGAQYLSFSGSLPSKFYHAGILDKKLLGDLYHPVAKAVELAIKKVIHEEAKDIRSILLLGGGGSLGQFIQQRLHQSGFQTQIIEVGGTFSGIDQNTPHLLLDVSTHGAIDHCLDQLWPNLVILNEVYPEPHKATIKKIKEQGMNLYHLVGIPAFSFPRFPKSYAGGIPCCTLTEDSSVSEVTLKRL